MNTQTTSKHEGMRTQQLHGAGAGREVSAIIIYQVKDGKPTGKQWHAGRWIEAAGKMPGDPVAVHGDVTEIHAGPVARIVRKDEGPSYTAALAACQPFAVVTKGRTVLYVPAELMREDESTTTDEHGESKTRTTYAAIRLAHVRHRLELIPEGERVGPYWRESKYTPQTFEAIRIETGSHSTTTAKGRSLQAIADQLNEGLHHSDHLRMSIVRHVAKWAKDNGANI